MLEGSGGGDPHPKGGEDWPSVESFRASSGRRRRKNLRWNTPPRGRLETVEDRSPAEVGAHKRKRTICCFEKEGIFPKRLVLFRRPKEKAGHHSAIAQMLVLREKAVEEANVAGRNLAKEKTGEG